MNNFDDVAFDGCMVCRREKTTVNDDGLCPICERLRVTYDERINAAYEHCHATVEAIVSLWRSESLKEKQ